ncbi:MAG: copper resistance protein NlpE N-terminal domain-containing protein [Caldilineaceae bacterium]
MRFKLLPVLLVALGLLVACGPGHLQRGKMMPKLNPPKRQAISPTPTPPAAPTQATPKFIGIYKHFSIAADAPAIDSTLYLNVDHTFKLISEYIGKATNTEVGTWTANLDGSATVTTTGQLDQKYDTPIVAKARFADDSQTVLTLTAGGENAKSDKWMRFEALVQDYTKAGYDAKAATDAIQERHWAGSYKAALPAADCCGLDISLFLNADKSADFRSDYLNGKAPVEEVGSWTASATQTLTSTAPVTVTVTITGQKGQPSYDKPQVLQLTWQNGILVTTKTSTILPDGRLKLYSIDGLIAPQWAVVTAQSPATKPALDPMLEQMRQRHPFLFRLFRFFWRFSEMMHKRWPNDPGQPGF